MFMTTIELKLGKVFPACLDPIFKNLLKDSSNRKFLAKIISFTTGISYTSLLKKMVLVDNNTLEDSRYVHHNEQDIIVKIDNKHINIEMSLNHKKINVRKNAITAHKLAGNLYKVRDDYENPLIFYQICIENYNFLRNGLLITETGMADFSSGQVKPIDKEFKIFHVNLNNIPNKCYNELNEEEKYFKFFLLDDIKELEKLCEGDEIMKHALEILKTLTTDPNVISEFENDRIRTYATEVAMNEKAKNAEKRGKRKGRIEGKIEGKIEGRIEGERVKQIEIAKKMLLKNVNIDTIIEFTGLTKEELEKQQ